MKDSIDTYYISRMSINLDVAFKATRYEFIYRESKFVKAYGALAHALCAYRSDNISAMDVIHSWNQLLDWYYKEF